MNESANDTIEGLLEFFILNTLWDEPMDGSAIERRTEQARSLLEYRAQRTGRRSPGPLAAAIERLERARWIEAGWRETENLGPERMYSLTPAGKERLAAERERRASILARFIEHSALDESFRKFLNRNM